MSIVPKVWAVDERVTIRRGSVCLVSLDSKRRVYLPGVLAIKRESTIERKRFSEKVCVCL